MNGNKRCRNVHTGSKKAVDTDKQKLEGLVRYLARRAAERDYAAMQDKQNNTDSKAVKP